MSNGRMAVKVELVWILKETVVVCLKYSLRIRLGGPRKMSGSQNSRPRIFVGLFLI